MNGKKIRKSLLGEKYLWENSFTFPLRIHQIIQTHGVSFSNSFSTCIGQQIQMDISWLKSIQLKFTDIGNSTFRQEEYSKVE